jgi:hypothetical protein
MSKSMLGGRGGSTITDAAVFRINKVKTTVLEFLGNVDIQAQKIIIDINVESNNLIIGDISDELIYIEQQLETIQNDISNTELNIENINENLFDISNTLFINIKNELSEISNISTSIHDNTSNITIKLGNNGNTMEYYTNEILDDLSSNIDSSSNHDIVNSVKSIYSILVDLCNNSTYTYDTYDTNKLYSLKVDVSNLNYNINDISQQYFFRDYSEKIESIYHNFKNIDKIINYNYSIENDILDILAHLNFPNSSNSQNIPNNQVKSLYDLLYYFKINSTYNLDESNNVKVLNINMNSLNYEISNDETLEYFFNDYIQKIDDIYNKINDISNNYIEKTINDIDNKLSNILSDLSSSNTTLSTYNPNNQVKSLYHLFADLCNNIIDISYDTQTNNLLDISINISHFSYDICDNNIYFFHDYIKKVEDISNNISDICGNIKTNIVIQNSSGIYDDISNIKNLVSNSNVLTFVDNIEKSIVKIDYYNGNIIDFSNKINEKINIDNHIQNNFNSITNIDSSINSIYTNTLNIVNDICYALYQLNTIDISLLNLDSTLDNIDSSNELILQNNVEIKSAATTINTQYTVARSSINAIDPLNI